MIKEPKLLTFGLNPFHIGGHSVSTITYTINKELIYETRIVDQDGEAFVEHQSEQEARRWHLDFISNINSRN